MRTSRRSPPSSRRTGDRPPRGPRRQRLVSVAGASTRLVPTPRDVSVRTVSTVSHPGTWPVVAGVPVAQAGPARRVPRSEPPARMPCRRRTAEETGGTRILAWDDDLVRLTHPRPGGRPRPSRRRAKPPAGAGPDPDLARRGGDSPPRTGHRTDRRASPRRPGARVARPRRARHLARHAARPQHLSRRVAPAEFDGRNRLPGPRPGSRRAGDRRGYGHHSSLVRVSWGGSPPAGARDTGTRRYEHGERTTTVLPGPPARRGATRQPSPTRGAARGDTRRRR